MAGLGKADTAKSSPKECVQLRERKHFLMAAWLFFDEEGSTYTSLQLKVGKVDRPSAHAGPPACTHLLQGSVSKTEAWEWDPM